MEAFYLEQRLKEKNPGLHERVLDNIAVLNTMLQKYAVWFPEYTDHSILHSMDVIEFCNWIIGEEQVQKLLPEECFVLLMSCYLHDIGMGISRADYEALSKELGTGDRLFPHERPDVTEIIRIYHHEYSGLLIRKYADLFDIPEKEYLQAIIQISRGHRKTDLFDREEFGDIPIAGGVIRTAYLSAVMRLADEIDVASTRNPETLFDISKIKTESQIKVFGIHESVQKVEVRKDLIVLYSRPKTKEYIPLVWNLTHKIQNTLDYCRAVAEKRSDLRITQTQAVIRPEPMDADTKESFSWPVFQSSSPEFP